MFFLFNELIMYFFNKDIIIIIIIIIINIIMMMNSLQNDVFRKSKIKKNILKPSLEFFYDHFNKNI